MKRMKGITLIALVITIIVLLILAGVAISTLTGDGSIIKNANEAVAKYNNKVNEEKLILNNMEKYIQNGEVDNPTDTGSSTSTGKSTLLLEKKTDPNLEDGLGEEEIQIDNIDKYKSIYFLEYTENEANLGFGITIPISVIKNSSIFQGNEYGGVRITNSNMLGIKYLQSKGYELTYRVYGIE